MDRRQIDQLHEQASEHYVRGEFLDAVAAWKQILDFDPEDEKAREGLRVSSHMDQSATTPPPEGYVPGGDNGRLRACLAEVESRVKSGDLRGAMRAAELLRVEHPEDPSVLSVLAETYSLAGESDKAAEMMARFLALSPEYAAAAALLEECRQVSPHESHLGSVVVRDGESGFGSGEPEVVATTGGVFASEAVEDGMASEEVLSTYAEMQTGAEEKGLAVPDPTSSLLDGPKDAPAAALRERVSELLRQARAAKADGRHEDALGFVSRILILDDGNDEAMRLEEEIRKLSGAVERDLERLITEGAHLFDLGRHEEARQIFLQVLEKSPSHREAIGYLERVDAQMARSGASGGASEGRARGKVWNPPGTETDLRGSAVAGTAVAEEDDLLEAPEVEGEEGGFERPAAVPGEDFAEIAQPRVPFSLRRIPDLVGQRFFVLFVTGSACILLTVLISWWFARDSGTGELSASVEHAVPAAVTKGKRDFAKGPKETEATQTALSAAEKDARIAGFFAQGEDAFTRKDYEAAIVAFNEVARLDPDNAAVRGKILAAGEEYKKFRTDAEKLQKAKGLFAAGEYESALRMIYRLPEGMLPADLWERYKVAGWYNLGVVALRGANCKDSISYLNEARSLAPTDPDVRAARELADRCQAQSSDRSFYNRADGLAFRALDPPTPRVAVSDGSGAGR